MSQNTKGWVLGIIFGVLGIIVSVVTILIIALLTNKIYGLVAALAGIVSGGAVGLGYKIGKGRLATKANANAFIWVVTIFGLIGVLATYLVGGFRISPISAIIIFAGAYGGRYIGKVWASSMIPSHETEQAKKEEK